VPAAPPLILVVDDDVALAEMLAEALGDRGYRVAIASSAAEALEAVGRGAPDLVLTDVHMAGMTGVELCARLKGTPELRLTPVVLMTAVSDLDARVAGLAAGADDFFAKPMEFVELGTRVAALLRVKALVDQRWSTPRTSSSPSDARSRRAIRTRLDIASVLVATRLRLAGRSEWTRC
jgi:DNA-binding response OmpR family regulator